MKVYKTRSFARFARQQTLLDTKLTNAIERALSGLVDGDLAEGLSNSALREKGEVAGAAIEA